MKLYKFKARVWHNWMREHRRAYRVTVAAHAVKELDLKQNDKLEVKLRKDNTDPCETFERALGVENRITIPPEVVTNLKLEHGDHLEVWVKTVKATT